MRLGRINSYSKEGFDSTATLGLEFIEVCCNNSKEANAFIAAKQDVKEQIARTGINISSVGRWNHDLNQSGILEKEKFDEYIALLDVAIELGAKTFVCGINKDESISLYQNYKVAVEFFSKLIAHADRRIKIAVQNCNWNNFIVSEKEWEVVLGELDELYLKYDPSHAYNRNSDYLAEMSNWGDRIAHFHIKGSVHAGKNIVDDPPAGMDDINWGSVFAILYSRKYDGDLSIEPHSAVWQGDLEKFGIQFTRDFIKKFIYK